MRFLLCTPVITAVLKALCVLVALSSPLAISAAESKDEEFVIEVDCPRPCLPVHIDGKQYRFIVDTGASETTFDPRLRRHLGEFRGRSFLDQKNQGGVLVDEYGPTNAFVRMAPLTEKRTVRCFDLTSFRALDDSEYDGMVGVDFLNKYVVQFDLDGKRIRLLSKVPDDVGEPFSFVDDSTSRPVIQMRLCNNGNDIDGNFLVDTGAQGGLCVRQSEFRALFNAGQISYPELFRTWNADGNEIAIRGRLSSARLGPFAIREVTVATDEHVKWIGMKCLSRFLVTIDFPGRMVYLKERKQFANQADRWDLSGMWVRRHAAQTIVDSVMPSSPGEAAGLRAGDVIESIDGVPATSLSVTKIRRIFEDPGRSVSITLRRDEEVVDATVLLKEYRKERPTIRRWPGE